MFLFISTETLVCFKNNANAGSQYSGDPEDWFKEYVLFGIINDFEMIDGCEDGFNVQKEFSTNHITAMTLQISY